MWRAINFFFQFFFNFCRQGGQLTTTVQPSFDSKKLHIFGLVVDFEAKEYQN